MKKLAAKLWAVLMLMLVSMQTMATDTFTSNRTDFRDESIYFMMTTRFYDGDTAHDSLSTISSFLSLLPSVSSTRISD